MTHVAGRLRSYDFANEVTLDVVEKEYEDLEPLVDVTADRLEHLIAE